MVTSLSNGSSLSSSLVMVTVTFETLSLWNESKLRLIHFFETHGAKSGTMMIVSESLGTSIQWGSGDSVDGHGVIVVAGVLSVEAKGSKHGSPNGSVPHTSCSSVDSPSMMKLSWLQLLASNGTDL